MKCIVLCLFDVLFGFLEQNGVKLSVNQVQIVPSCLKRITDLIPRSVDTI
jgi:hypothetical protein